MNSTSSTNSSFLVVGEVVGLWLLPPFRMDLTCLPLPLPELFTVKVGVSRYSSSSFSSSEKFIEYELPPLLLPLLL